MKRNIMGNSDEHHLRLLTIFHYVLAGIYAFVGCIPIVHVSLGIAMVAGAFDGQPDPPPPGMGATFAAVGGSFMILFWTLALLMVFAGRCLARRSHYSFCFF